jgi:hypothetical protein
MKWYTSSSSVAVRWVSSMKGEERAKELWVSRIKSELESVSPRSCVVLLAMRVRFIAVAKWNVLLVGTRPQTP